MRNFDRTRSTWTRRLHAVRTAVLLSALTLGAACNDDIGEEEEPEIEAVRLTVTPPGGTATSYVVRTSGATPSPVALRVGSNAVTAVALGANNQSITLDPDFELRVVGGVQGSTTQALPTGFTSTGNGTLSTTIVVAAGTTGTRTLAIQLFHRGEGHSDFDAALPVSVAP